MTSTSREVRVLSFDATCPSVPIIQQGGKAAAVVWPGTGAEFRTMHHITLSEGGQTIPLHHQGEAVYYVRQGSGRVTDPTAAPEDLIEGSIAFIEPGTQYQFTAGPQGMTLIGGPCPPDLSLYAQADAA